MQRLTRSILGGLLALALVAGCSSGNDAPDSASDTTSEDGGGSTTTTALFGGDGGDGTTTTGGGDSPSGDDGGDDSGVAGVPTGSGSSDPTSSADAATPQDIGTAIGEGCANYADVGAAQQQPGTAAEGTCEFGGEIINLYTFADGAAQREFVDSGAFFDCSFIVAFGGGGSTYYVSGDKWIARPGTEEVAGDLAAALDGEVETYTCEAR
jgi:hypothetical protein